MAIAFPSISPITIKIGPIAIRWYALAYLAGFLLSWVYALRIVKWDKDKPDTTPYRRVAATDIDDFLPWAVAGVILGGRIGYILFYQFAMYAEHPLAIFKIWEGGMSFHGGTIGVILAMIIFSIRRKIHVLRLTDIICACVPIGLFFGRIANFVNAELFGRVTTASWGVVFPNGGDEPRHPSQLYEAILEGAVLFAILAFLIRNDKIRNKPGIVSGVFLCGYALARMTVEFFREPDVQIGYIADIFTMGQILCVPMVVGGLYLIIRAYRTYGRA